MSKLRLTGRQRRKLARKDKVARFRKMIARAKRSLVFINDHQPEPESEIKRLALAIYRHEVFASWELPEREDVAMHFMPMLFLSIKQRAEIIAMDPGVVIAPMSDALKTGLNGYPIFSSLRILSKDDSRRLLAEYQSIETRLQGEHQDDPATEYQTA